MTVYRPATPQSSKFHFKQVIGVILGCLLVNGLLFTVLYRHWEYQTIIATLESERDLNFETLRREEIVTSRELHSPAWTLIEETRAIIAEAGGEPGTLLTLELRKAWEDQNPCAGRRPLTRLWNRQRLRSFGDPDSVPSIAEPSVLLYALFEEYANLHRTCTKGGDIKYAMEEYRSGNSTRPCKFLVVEFGAFGIGNRMLWLISAFQYALLTKRVLLIDTRSTIHELLCQPFPGSSWLLPQDFDYSSEQRWPMPAEFQEQWDDWESKESEAKKKAADMRMRESNALRKWDKMTDLQHLQERRETLASVLSRIQAEVDRNAWELEVTEVSFGRTRQLIENIEPQPTFFRVQGNDGWAPNPRFLCENEQQHLHKVKWISMNSGCLYFLPNLFAVPSFRPTLEELYPDRDPVTHLLRHLTLPVNSIWEDVRATYKKHFSSASKVVGIQVRYRDGPLMYRNLNEIVNAKIYRCSVNNGILPQPAAVMTARRSMDNNHEGPVVIFVASLYSGLADHLQKIYSKAIESSSRPLRLIQLSEVRYQSFGAEGDQQAFVEILCLSLADEIVTSPVSTFGQMAQGYGALVPWLINFNPDATDCVRGQSSDACYQLAIEKFTCPLDPNLHGMAMMDMVPYLKPCQDTDGLQLIPPWNTSQP